MICGDESPLCQPQPRQSAGRQLQGADLAGPTERSGLERRESRQREMDSEQVPPPELYDYTG